MIAAVLAAGILTIVLTSGNDDASARQGGTVTSGAPGPAPTSAGQPPSPGNSAGGAPGSGRPLPPPTPTGQLYKDTDPTVGACADLSRKATGVSIYQADCGDPAAMLILESVQPDGSKCPGKGYFGLNALSKQLLCFTYNLTTGDCVDLIIPRRTSCDDTSGSDLAPPKSRVSAVHLGQRDGTGCPDPNLYYQVGKGEQRGVGCLVDLPIGGEDAPPPTSR